MGNSRRVIPLRPLCAAAYAPYGELLGPGPEPSTLDRAALVEEWLTRARAHLGDAVEVNHVRPLPRKDPAFSVVEVHPKSDQVSVTLDSPFIFAVFREGVDLAVDGSLEEALAAGQVDAFEVPVNTGITIRAGLWHSGTLPQGSDTEAVFVFHENTLRVNTAVRTLPAPVAIGG